MLLCPGLDLLALLVLHGLVLVLHHNIRFYGHDK
jgi:hypothetical protein